MGRQVSVRLAIRKDCQRGYASLSVWAPLEPARSASATDRVSRPPSGRRCLEWNDEQSTVDLDSTERNPEHNRIEKTPWSCPG